MLALADNLQTFLILIDHMPFLDSETSWIHTDITGDKEIFNNTNKNQL